MNGWHGAASPGRGRASVVELQAALATFATEVLVLVSPRGEIVAATGGDLLGYDQGRDGRHIAETLHPDDLPKVFDVIERARATAGFEEAITVRARHADGSWRFLECTIVDSQRHELLRGPLVGAVIRVKDLTGSAEAVGALTGNWSMVQGDRFLSLAESLPSGILSADARGHVVFCNEAAQQILNLPAEELQGKGWERVIHAEDLPDVLAACGQVIRAGVQQQVTFRVQTGLFVRWATAKFVPLVAGDARTGWIATVDDVTDRRRAESDLAHRATHDPLTGLPNRTLLEDRLHQACARLRRGGSSVAVLFIDLDDFKAINDSRGHAVGDLVLVEVARRLRQVLRDVDTVARLGGDEFVAVCEGLEPGGPERISDRIEEAFAVPMLVEGDSLVVGASVGIALTENPVADVGELLARADQAMYRMKRRRRGA
jgi:diguanylate cyclase (GGDEF)-like protein/PAS domain S-box-containing protein